MKKRHWLFLITAVIILTVFILPPFVQRVNVESGHKQYSTAIELSGALDGVSPDEYIPVLEMYKKSGVNFALLSENNQSFNTEYGRIAKKAGLRTALAVYGGEEKSSDYADMLNRTIEELDIQYIVIKNTNKNNKRGKGDLRAVAEAIRSYNLTLVLSEYGKTQLSNENPQGIEQCILAADGRLMRAYESQKNPRSGLTADSGITGNSELVYHQMHNSATDRNTEFLIINQLETPGLSTTENASETANAVSRFCAKMDSLGYVKGEDPNIKSYSTAPVTAYGGTAALGVLMCLALINLIRKKSDAKLDWIMYAGAFLAFALTMAMPAMLLSLYPTAFSAAAPCFCLTLCYRAISESKTGLAAKITIGLSTALASLLLCALVLCSLLSGAEYYLNILIFRGVKLTLILPSLFAMLLPFIADREKGSPLIAGTAITNAIKSIRLRHILIFIPVIIVGAIYIMRSGNAQISETENAIRNFISEMWNARPRTKEFLVGWPCVMLLAITVHFKGSKLFRWIFTVGSSILFASVSNTFCHVFTDASISFSRTLNGFVMSLPFMLLIGAVSILIIKTYRKFNK